MRWVCSLHSPGSSRAPPCSPRRCWSRSRRGRGLSTRLSLRLKSQMSRENLILLCAGGTGGQLFPAEALAVALNMRGITVDLATDHRAAHFKFPARNVHLIPSATLRKHKPKNIAKTAALLTY